MLLKAVERKKIVYGLYLSLRKTFIVIETRQDVVQVAATRLGEGSRCLLWFSRRFLLFVWFFFGPPDFFEVPDHPDQRRKVEHAGPESGKSRSESGTPDRASSSGNWRKAEYILGLILGLSWRGLTLTLTLTRAPWRGLTRAPGGA